MPKIMLNGVNYSGAGGSGGGDGSYVLLPATETRLGGIKGSASVQISADGTATAVIDDAELDAALETMFATDEEVEAALDAIFN